MLGLTTLKDGSIDAAAPLDGQDLVPHAKGKEGSFKFIPNGCPGIETRLPLLFCNGVEGGRISAERFVELTSTNRELHLSRLSSQRC